MAEEQPGRRAAEREFDAQLLEACEEGLLESSLSAVAVVDDADMGEYSIVVSTVGERRSRAAEKEELDVQLLRACEAGSSRRAGASPSVGERSLASPVVGKRSSISGAVAASRTAHINKEELGWQLLQACQSGSLAEVDALLKQGACVEYESARCWGAWPLGLAAANGHTDVIELLLEHKGDANFSKAVELGVREGHTGVIKLLLERSADAIQPSVLVALLSDFFMKDGSDPIILAEALLQRVAGHGVNNSDAAFAECRAQDGLDVWFEKESAWSVYGDGDQDRATTEQNKKVLVSRVTGEFSRSVGSSHVGAELGEFFREVVLTGRMANRFARPVKVDLHEARHVTMEVLDDRKLVDVLATTGNMDLFNTTLVECMMRHLWLTIAPWAYLDIVVNAGVVASACAASGALARDHTSVGPTLWWILAAATSKRALEELAQLCHTWRSRHAASFAERLSRLWRHSDCRVSGTIPCAISFAWSLVHSTTAYALQLDNLFDMAALTLSVVSLATMRPSTDIKHIEPASRFLLAMWFALLWLRLLYSLRVLRLVGPRFLPIFRTIQDTVGFYFVVAFTFAASVHSYLTLHVREHPPGSPGPFYAALVQMFKLYFFGDFDLHELEGVDPTYVPDEDNGTIYEPEDPEMSPNYIFVHGLFYVVAVCFSVVLMNLFIGILGASYDVQEDVAIPVFLQSRAVAVAKYRSLPWVKAFSWAYRRLVGYDGERHLCALVRCAPSSDSTRSLRSYLSLTERRINEKICRTERRTAALDKKIESLDKNVKDLDGSLKDVNQKMDRLLKLMLTVADKSDVPARASGAETDESTTPTAGDVRRERSCRSPGA